MSVDTGLIETTGPETKIFLGKYGKQCGKSGITCFPSSRKQRHLPKNGATKR